MQETFKEISPLLLTDNFISLIGTDWMLVTAGTATDFNTMTASWGSIGFMWNKPVATIVVRPQRHTYSFLEKQDSFSLSFFTEAFKPMLQYCGSNSGKKVDKIKETGLEPLYTESGVVYFKQARLVLECKKLYVDDFKKDCFVDKSLLNKYVDDDFHRVYIAEIVKCLTR
ncbi:MAG: flavin reductase [Bacteroidales bacterium]|nr:flavin reductase [Bacteroidales bacterium]